MLVPGDGKDPVQVIDGRDLGEWMIRLAETGTTGTFNAVGPEDPLLMDAMLDACEAGTGGSKPKRTYVDAEFVEQQEVELPIWVPRQAGPYAGFGQVSNARAIAAGLTYRPLETTVRDLMAWFDALPAERKAKLNAGITRGREAELLQAWQARRG